MWLDGRGCPRLQRSEYRFFKIDFSDVLFVLGTVIPDCEMGLDFVWYLLILCIFLLLRAVALILPDLEIHSNHLQLVLLSWECPENGHSYRI